jgi:hypothetical protein
MIVTLITHDDTPTIPIDNSFRVKWTTEYLKLHKLFKDICDLGAVDYSHLYHPRQQFYIKNRAVYNMINCYKMIPFLYVNELDFYIDENGLVYLVRRRDDTVKKTIELYKCLMENCVDIVDANNTNGVCIGNIVQVCKSIEALMSYYNAAMASLGIS